MTDAAPAPPLPDPPAGYAPARRIPDPGLRLQVFGLSLALLGFFTGASLALAARGPTAFDGVLVAASDATGASVTVDVAVLLGTLLATAGLTVVCHEAVHGVVLRWYGYDVTYGVAASIGGFYAAAFGQYVGYRRTAAALAAPLVALDAAAVLVLLAGPPGLPVAVAWFVLALNTGGAAADCWSLWAMRDIDPDAVFYDVDLRRSYYFPPERN